MVVYIFSASIISFFHLIPIYLLDASEKQKREILGMINLDREDHLIRVYNYIWKFII